MAYRLGQTSLSKLEGVHPDLVKVIKRAIELTPIDFRVIEGRRSLDRQKQLVARGASKTMNSRHLVASNGFVHAVDVIPLEPDGDPSWAWPDYYPLAKAVKAAAAQLLIPIEWGGDWKSFKDGPHWQLPFKEYPK